jgi:hypothetical protein
MHLEDTHVNMIVALIVFHRVQAHNISSQFKNSVRELRQGKVLTGQVPIANVHLEFKAAQYSRIKRKELVFRTKINLVACRKHQVVQLI